MALIDSTTPMVANAQLQKHRPGSDVKATQAVASIFIAPSLPRNRFDGDFEELSSRSVVAAFTNCRKATERETDSSWRNKAGREYPPASTLAAIHMLIFDRTHNALLTPVDFGQRLHEAVPIQLVLARPVQMAASVKACVKLLWKIEGSKFRQVEFAAVKLPELCTLVPALKHSSASRRISPCVTAAKQLAPAPEHLVAAALLAQVGPLELLVSQVSKTIQLGRGRLPAGKVV